MLFRRSPAGLAGLLACAATSWMAAAARAESPPDPLRLVPASADLVLKIEKPRGLVEAFTSQPVLQQLLQFEAVRDALDTASVRRFYQLLAYYERELGAAWPELLDQTAGGGIVLAVQLSADQKDNKLLLAIQARDEKQLRKLFELVQRVVQDELDRQDAKVRLEKTTYKGVEGVKVGPDFCAAGAGSTLLVANKVDVLKTAIDRHQGDFKSGPGVLEAKKFRAAKRLVGEDALAWLYFDLAKAKQAPGAKDVFSRPANDQNLTVLFGGWIDTIRRSDFVAAGFYRESDGLRLSVRLPAGRDGMTEEMAFHVPLKGQPGTLPPLEPAGTLFSTSFYLDLAAMWEQRAKLFPPKVVKGLEDFDKQGSRFTVGTSVSKLFGQSGPYHRVVVAQPSRPAYKTGPGTKIPAFAVVTSMRDPAFGQSLEAMLRAAGLFSLGQVKLSMKEEKVGDVTLVTYRFDEQAPLPADAGNIRFNFTPCFARVGDQFVLASTTDLGRELIGLLSKKRTPEPTTATSRMRFSGAGAAAALKAAEDQVITQAILDRAVPAERAKEEVAQFMKYLEQLGRLEVSSDYRADQFRFDLRWQMKAK